MDIVYLERTPMFVQVAESLGIRSILRTDDASTCAKLEAYSLHREEGAPSNPRNSDVLDGQIATAPAAHSQQEK